MTLMGICGLRLALTVVCFVVGSFALRAQDDPSKAIKLRVFFRFDSSVVSESYLDNPATFATIDSLVREGYPGDNGTIEIIANSSPEGSYRYNKALSERRANALRAYLENKYPGLEGFFTVNPGVEAWDDLLLTVLSDIRLNDDVRNRIVEIVSEDTDADVKEKSLRRIPEFRSLYSDWYSRFRYAEIALFPAAAFIPVGEDALKTAALSSFDILFAYNGSEISRDFMNNASMLDSLGRILDNESGIIHDIRIYGGSSPEGASVLNDKLASERSRTLREWILERRPDLADRIIVGYVGEAWEGFRRAVVSDSEIDDVLRNRILAVIDSDDTPEKKEARLKALPEYDEISERYFVYLRSSRIDVTTLGNAPERIDTIPVTPKIDTIPSKPETDIIPETTDTTVIESLIEPEYYLKPIFAASTNALYDILVTPNFALEFPIGRKWSAYAEYTFPWWLSPKNDWAYEMLKWDLGARYWFGADNTLLDDAFRGHFVGVDLSAGYYDFEPRHKGYQGEFQLAGLEYGYAFRLSPRWRLDAVIGAGWIGTHYRYYEADPTDRHLVYQHHGETTYFGPTKLGITFKYIFTTKKEVQR